LLLHGDDSFALQEEAAKVASDVFQITDHADFTSEICDEDGELLMDVEVMEYLNEEYELDFSDEKGNPLRCTRILSLVAIAAAAGVAGRLPDKESVQNWNWAQKIEEEATNFSRNKRR
jgi:hypothetical protein